jgi:DNA-binding transcriptional MerR regulator
MTRESDKDVTEPTYRIGAIARLTGISADTLRVWERRYQVVTPERSPKGSRLYSREDVARLALIKRLVDAGHAIGSIAGLGLVQLQDRLETQASALPSREGGPRRAVRVAVLGDTLPVMLGATGPALEGLEVSVLERDAARFREAARQARPGVLVLELPSVHEETGSEVRALLQTSGARRALVIYAFGRADAVRRLDTAEVTPLRAPVDPGELRRWCLAAGSAQGPLPAELVPSLPEPPAARRYDAETLSRIVRGSTTVRCECPHHLAQLVFSLGAFEQYSAECESRNAEDAALHRYLHLTTARARAMIEEALARVVEVEGLDTTPGDG